MKNLKLQEQIKKAKQNKKPDIPSRKDFYEYMNRARYDKQQHLLNFGIMARQGRHVTKSPVKPSFNATNTSKDLMASMSSKRDLGASMNKTMNRDDLTTFLTQPP